MPEHLLRGQRVDIAALRIDALQGFDIGDVRDQPQLDLVIVGRHDDMARRRHEGMADAPAHLGADGDILQVGIVGRQPAGGGGGEVEIGVDPVGLRVDLRLQRIGVGGFELGMLAPVQHLLGDRRALFGQPFQFAGIGGPGTGLAALLARLQAHPVEQYLAQLLGAADGEFGAGQREDLALQPLDLHFIGGRQTDQFGAVHPDAGHLHLRDHRQQRAVHLFMDRGHLLLPQPAAEALPEAEGDIGILGGIVGGRAQRHLGKALQPPGHVLVGDRRVAKMAGGQIVHAMVPAPGIERVTQQHRVVEGAEHGHAVTGQHDQIIFEIVADLEHGRIGEQRVQPVDHHLAVKLVGALGKHAVAAAVGDRDVAGLAGRRGQRNAHQFGAHLVGAGGFRIHRHLAQPRGLGNPPVQPFERRHRLIVGMDEGHLVFGHVCGRWPVRVGCRAVAAGGPQLGQHGAEAVLLEEGRQGLVRRLLQCQFIERRRQRQIVLQAHQFAGEARHVDGGGQRFLQLRLPDRLDVGDHAFHVAMCADQIGGGLGADAAHAGHIVGGVAHQRQHLAHLFGRHAKLVDHLFAADQLVLHRVEQIHAGANQLHQVLVGTDDRDIEASAARRHHIGGDDVVRLHALLFKAGHAERPHRIADQRELRHQIFGWRRAVGLVAIIHVVAEGVAAGIEHHGKMGGGLGPVELGNQLPQHRREAVDSAHRRALRIGERRQPMIGAEDEAAAVDKIEMLGHACLVGRSGRL